MDKEQILIPFQKRSDPEIKEAMESGYKIVILTSGHVRTGDIFTETKCMWAVLEKVNPKANHK